MSDNPAFGLSWDGHNIYSAEKRSIDAVKVALHKAAQIEEYRQAFQSENDALRAEVEQLREELKAETERRWDGNRLDQAEVDEEHGQLRAEIERLRELLKDWYDAWNCYQHVDLNTIHGTEAALSDESPPAYETIKALERGDG